VPSIWVKPRGDWGEGEVHLVELPTNYEGLDNIVAFWNPKQKPAPLQPLRLSYELLWTRERDFTLSANHVAATMIGPDGRDTTKRQVHIDFSGPRLDAIDEKTPPVPTTNCSSNAKIYEVQVIRNPYGKAWRVVLKFEPQAGSKDPVELRCTLKQGEEAVSETWSYLWSPPA